MRSSRRLLLIGAILATVMFAGSTSAWAYFRTTGWGTGTANAGQLSVQVLSPAGTELNTTLLLPGRTADALVRVYNPQSGPVELESVTPNGDPVASNGCTPTGVSFAGQSELKVLIPAKATVLIPLPGSVSMSLASAVGCQGASFDIPVTVTVRS
jgi:hypothetical protein